MANIITGELAHTFTFANSRHVRVIDRNGEPWFVAADVCAALEIGNITNALKRLDADEQSLYSIKGQEFQGAATQNIINESGLYNLTLGSRKPEAKKFKKWVTSEVLPTIRKTGRYESQSKPIPVLDVKTLCQLILGGIFTGRDFIELAYAVNQHQFTLACNNPHRGYGEEVASKIKDMSWSDLHTINQKASMEVWMRSEMPQKEKQ